MLNKDKIDFDEDDEARILSDAIGWLEMLDDLKERLTDLGDDFEMVKYSTDEEDFKNALSHLARLLEEHKCPMNEIWMRILR